MAAVESLLRSADQSRGKPAETPSGSASERRRLRPRGPHSLRSKLAITIIGFSTLIIVGLGSFAYESARRALVAATASDLISAASEKEQAIESWLRLSKSTLVALSTSGPLKERLANLAQTADSSAASDRRRVARALRGWVRSGGLFESIFLVEPSQGRVVFATMAADLDTYKEARDYFILGRQSPTVVGPYHSATLDEVVFAAAAPVLADDETLIGVLVGRLNMREIDQIMQRRRGLSETFDSYLVNTAHVFVSQPRELRDPAILTRGAFTHAVDLCLDGQSGWDIGPDYRGVVTISAYEWLPELRLCILSKLDKDEAFRPSNVLGWTTLAGGGIAILVAAMLAMIVSSWIARPILSLLAATREIRDGNLDVDLPSDGNDEIARLALGFSEMAQSLKARDRKIDEYTRTLEQRVEEELFKNREKDAVVLQQSRLAALGEMIGNIAHQWRQPLNALCLVLGNIKDARDHGELDEAYLDAQVGQGMSIANGMSATIEDFRTFFRPERERQRFRPSDAVRRAQNLIEAAFASDDIGVTIDLDEDVEVLGFPNEYAQVALNLLVNARDAVVARRKHTGIASAGNVKIAFGRRDDTARLTVSDDAGGIPETITGKIFDPYFTTRDHGTGIGLYLSKTIIERNMHGRIAVRNTGSGAEFTVDVPLAPTEGIQP